MPNDTDTTDDGSTDPDPANYSVHHVAEAEAERAVDRFRRKVDRIEAGEANDVTASGPVYLHDSLHEVLHGPDVYLVDGQPLDEWLGGRVEETRVEVDAD
jgi:hypothetical protein